MKLGLFSRLLGILGVVGATLGSLPSHAASPYTSLTVFGDSLSDTGNIFLATGGAIPTAPYFSGRFSDGPIWIDTVAAGLGLPGGAVPSLAGGGNYAFGGARSGTDAFPPGTLAQIGGLWAPSNPVADPTGLYVLVVGGNDMRDARSTYTGDSAADMAGRQAVADQAAVNIIAGLSLLSQRGAKNVLVANVPDLGLTPEAAFLGVQAASSDATARFNATMGVVLGVGSQLLGLNMSFLDMAGLTNAIVEDAMNNGGMTYGISNVTMPCGAFPGSMGASCAVSLFSDALHPSARAHQILGNAALLAVGVVPEPGTFLLLAFGLAGLLAWSRRRTA